MALEEHGATADLQAVLKERLKALHLQQQHLQQTTQALCCSTGIGSSRPQAAWQLTQQQAAITQTACLFRQDAQTLQRVKQANTQRLQYDQTAIGKVLHCMKLEQEARLLDTVASSRQYNRLHPRYTLE